MKSLQWLISVSLVLVFCAAGACAQVVGGFSDVKAAPFSADVVFESTRILAHGNNRKHSETRIKISGMKTEKLENKQIEDFNASGTRSSRVIEAGRAGKSEPITEVSETWYSPDLKATLLSTLDSPSGQTIVRLTNIRIGDPDPRLFQIPPDYTIPIPHRYTVRDAPHPQ